MVRVSFLVIYVHLDFPALLGQLIIMGKALFWEEERLRYGNLLRPI